MRLTLDLLGRRLEVSLGLANDDEGEPQRESALDALVERSDPYAPPIGFYPRPRDDEVLD